MTPYGEADPDGRARPLPGSRHGGVVHAPDISFCEGAYPGAIPPFPIGGLRLSRQRRHPHDEASDPGRGDAVDQSGQHRPAIGRPPRPRAARLGSGRRRAASAGSLALRRRRVRPHGTGGRSGGRSGRRGGRRERLRVAAPGRGVHRREAQRRRLDPGRGVFAKIRPRRHARSRARRRPLTPGGGAVSDGPVAGAVRDSDRSGNQSPRT